MSNAIEGFVEDWTEEKINVLFDQMQWSVIAIDELISGVRVTNSVKDRDNAIKRNLDHLVLSQEKSWYVNSDRDKSIFNSAINKATQELELSSQTLQNT